MDEERTTTAELDPTVGGVDGIADDEPEVLEELLVEEISIDGMCGVY